MKALILVERALNFTKIINERYSRGLLKAFENPSNDFICFGQLSFTGFLTLISVSLIRNDRLLYEGVLKTLLKVFISSSTCLHK